MAPTTYSLADVHDLNRRIYARLPFGYRVANTLVVLAADGIEAFGRSVAAVFIGSAVRGMPDAGNGKSAFDLIQEVYRKGADALPPGYGRPFASRVFKILLSKFGGDAEIAEEAMSAVTMSAVRGKLHISNGTSVHQAESYVITACFNAARDLLRSRDRRREVPLVRDRDDDDGANIDVEDPNAFAKVERLLSPDELQRILRELETVHERAPSFVEALMAGENQNEIARDWATSASYVAKWLKQYGPGVREVFQRHLQASRRKTGYSYERPSRTVSGMHGYSYERSARESGLPV